jgi:hypothetical protein
VRLADAPLEGLPEVFRGHRHGSGCALQQQKLALLRSKSASSRRNGRNSIRSFSAKASTV